jgi:signal transduction histidine kinase
MTGEPMHVYDEMKAYVGFTEEDASVLADFWPVCASDVHPVIDHFYERILATPAAVAVLQDAAQVERLKGTLRRWLEELVRGPHDYAYFERRERIGRVHVDVGLPSRFMFTAMSVMREDLCAIALERLPEAQARRTCSAIERVSSLDLAIMTGTYIDTREERQLRLLRELIVAHLPVTVLLLDAEKRVTAATRPASRLFEGGDLIGRALEDALPRPLLEASELAERVARAMSTRRDIALPRVDARIEQADRAFRVTIVPLDRADAAVMLHIEDLTDTIEVEARLRRSESLAQLGALSAAVAHELRNPLAGISGAVQVITRSMPGDDPRRTIMIKVEEQIQRLNALVTDLLAFSRPTRVSVSLVQMRPLVESVVDLIHKQYPGVSFEIDGEGDAQADPNVLHQVLLNLAQNAAQAVEGQGEVYVRLRQGQVCVADSGPGVPEELRERIFEPFFTTRTRGTGLGLAICRKFAGALGGRLHIAPESPLSGACFQLELSAPAA